MVDLELAKLVADEVHAALEILEHHVDIEIPDSEPGPDDAPYCRDDERPFEDLFEGDAKRVPLVRGIYATIKSMMDVLSFEDKEKEKYSSVVMIEFPRKGQYALALVTGVTPGEIQDVSADRVINVYVPTSPNPTSGYLLFVPESELIPVGMSVDEALKMMFSGGMYTPAPPRSETVATGGGRRLP